MKEDKELMCVSVCVYMYMCVCVCVYVYTYTQISFNNTLGFFSSPSQHVRTHRSYPFLPETAVRRTKDLPTCLGIMTAT